MYMLVYTVPIGILRYCVKTLPLNTRTHSLRRPTTKEAPLLGESLLYAVADLKASCPASLSLNRVYSCPGLSVLALVLR